MPIAGFQCHVTQNRQNKNENHSTDKVQNLGNIQRPSPRFGSKE